MAAERDLIACLEANHKLMGEKEQLESEVVTLKLEIEEKQSKIRGVDESIARNREALLARCSTAPGKARAPVVPTPSSTRTLEASSATAAISRGHRRGPDRLPESKAKPVAALHSTPESVPKVPKKSNELPVLTEEASTVVKFEQGWAEISYHLCGANAVRKSGAYFHGMPGLKSHLSKIHKKAHISISGVIAKCKRRYLESGEVRAIRRGTSQIEKRFGAQGGEAAFSTSHWPQNNAPIVENDSDVIKIDAPALKKEERNEDAEFMAAAQPFHITTPERASGVRIEYDSCWDTSSESAPSSDLMDLLEDDVPRARPASPLAQSKRGLILPTVDQPEPRRSKDLPRRKRRYSLIGDGFDPLATPNEASRVKNKFTKLANDSQEDSDGLINNSAADKDDKIVLVERSDDGEA